MASGETKQNYSAKELAGLPGLPDSIKGVLERAARESWPFQKRAGRGGGREYPLASLPEETQKHLLRDLAPQASAKGENLPAVAAQKALALVEPAGLPAIATLKAWQRDTMDARVWFMRYIESANRAGLGVNKAIAALVEHAQNGTLPPEAQGMLALANAKQGYGRTLSTSSLKNWWSAWQASGHNPAALAPKGLEKAEPPAWAPYFLQCYRVPQKISVAHALEDLAAVLPPGIEFPSEHQVRRFLEKYSKLDVHKGRMTGKELKSLKGFTRRDTSSLEPLDVCLCDGHSFKAKIAHPVHGRPFHPEVCAVIDAATKVVIGWAAGLAESSQTVADAYRHAVTVNDQKRYGGIPVILYTDKGAGNEARVNSDPFVGMYARMGSTYKTGIPGNSQARGLIERAQRSLWIRAAQELPTYTGKGMDQQVQRKVYLALESDVKKAVKAGKTGKKSELLMGWQDFLDFCADQVEAYNRRPHTSLPRITDASGVRRHMCPLEMWSKFLADGRWQPLVPAPGELEALFRPHVVVTTRRGEVRLFGNLYYCGDLVHYNGQEVVVAYDIHDASQVWVKDREERLICIARFEANKRDFYPMSAVEQAREQRRKRRTATLERHLEEVQLESRPALEVPPVRIELPQAVIEFEARQEAKAEQVQATAKYFDNLEDLYDDIRSRATRGEASDYEITWADDYDRSMNSGKRLGLYKEDPNCTGRFKAAKSQ